MSRVDLGTHREALARAQTEVADVNNKINWALCGYEGKTNVVKVVETGDGGIEELVDELSSGKIQYAFCQMKDPNTGLPKNVFINWQGEGVPEIRKGSCANHVRDVTSLFRSAHLTINARTEEDVDEDLIKEKLAKASGSNYSVHKEQRRPEHDAPQGPVGSVYKKTHAHAEIAHASRGKFWDGVQDEQSKMRQQEVVQRREETQKMDTERKEREARETAEREKREAERVKKIREQKAYERKAEARDKTEEKENWEKQQVEAMRDEDERRKRSEKMRKERAAEARALVSRRPSDPASVFEQKPKSQFDEPSSPPPTGAPPTRKLKHTFLQEEEKPAPQGRKQPIQLPSGGGDERSPPASPAKSPATSPSYNQPAPSYNQPPPSKPPRHEPGPAAPPARPPPREPSPEPVPVSSPPAMPQTKNLLAQNMPARPPSDDEEEEDDDWGGDDTTSTPKAVIAPEAPLELYDDIANVNQSAPQEAPQELYDDITNVNQSAPQAEEQLELYDDITNVNQSAPPEAQDSSKGQCARALYDYQAAEENEISFDPDDIITNVDQIDDGWWLGVGPDGRQGMFPANYVELV